MWESQGTASDAAHRSHHCAAAAPVEAMYAPYRLEPHRLKKAGIGEPVTIRRAVREQYHGHVRRHG